METAEQLQPLIATKQTISTCIFSGYGLGWGLSDYYGRLRVGHTGGYDGMISAVTMIPDEKLGVVVLSNGMNPPMMAVTYYALNAFFRRRNQRLVG